MNQPCWSSSPTWISISAFVSGASTGIPAWVSKVRLYKNDYSHSWYSLNRVEQASRSLGMDIVVYKEDVIPIKNDKDAQKRLLGTEFWPFLQKTLPKYKKKIPMTDKDLELLLSTLHDWLARQGWITEEGAQT